MKRKYMIYALLSAIWLVIGCTGVYATSFLKASTDTVLATWNGSMQTTYLGTIGYSTKHVDWIKSKYGDDAANLYLEAVRTGDYYYYREATGDWNLTGSWGSDAPYTNSDSVQYNMCIVGSPASSIEYETYSWLGKYATVCDYLLWRQSIGYPYPDSSKEFAQAIVNGTVKKPAKLKSPTHIISLDGTTSTATTAAATASNSAVEALKTYKGNTAEFNAYNYYTRYTDLQAAIGPNGDALLAHYNQYGKTEGRNAK